MMENRYLKEVLLGMVLCLVTLSTKAAPADSVHWDDVLRQPSSWYETAEAQRIAENVLLYQHKNGGWYKNIDMAVVLNEAEQKKLTSEQERGGTTIDNSATFTQMRFLGRICQATGNKTYKSAFLSGMDYLLEAQYPAGGWPQYYPIREGYYEHITFNDGAMIGVMSLLRDIAQEKDDFSFVDKKRREKAEAAIEKGLKVILQTQIEVDGELTAWCAQYNHKTLEPAWARAYEPPSISGSESVGILRYLMEIENPDADVIKAVEGGVSWFQKVQLNNIRLLRIKDPSAPEGFDKVVGFDAANKTPIWARFYEMGTNYPMFLGRDSVIHYAISQIEYERRVNYGWLGDWPQRLLEKTYPGWHAQWNGN